VRNLKIVITLDETIAGQKVEGHWFVKRTDDSGGENTPIKTKEELIYLVNKILFDYLGSENKKKL